ncbi:MAG: CDP-alcohol phosphatidyltransferase family protein [Chloroflexi bacterium]|nr:CDP-alcohol phosphatidyltransferase family protein [Chloroflexota bacterium]
MHRAQARRVIARYFEDPATRLLHTLKLTPTMVTLIGLALNFGVAYLAAVDLLLPAGVLLLVASAVDMLDGALARLTGTESSFGAFIDSVSDRLGEAAVLFGLLVLFFNDESATGVVLVFLAMVASFMVSYLRARGEGLGIRSDVGFMTRPERMVVLAVGMLVGHMLVPLGIIVAFSTITAGQRLHHVWRQTRVRK